jgi:hypothetical protein
LHEGQALALELSARTTWTHAARDSKPSACWRPQMTQRR